MIIALLGEALGYIMRICYSLLQNYGLAIILFVFISKIILLPISIWVHKNGIKLVKMMPDINFLKANYYGDKDRIADEQSKIYKKEKYSPLASLIPLIIQIILLMGIVEVIYNPLTYILRLPSDMINALINLTGTLTGADITSNSIQLVVLSAVRNSSFVNEFLEIKNGLSVSEVEIIIKSISNLNMNFLGLDLSWIPNEMKGVTLIVPFLAAFCSWLQCFTQNRSSVLQSEQGKANQYSTMAFSVGLSLYLGWFVPVGVALYWVSSILMAIIQMYILNAAINPRKYINYQKLEESRKALSELENIGANNKQWYYKDPYRKREKADYKRFFSIANKHLVFYSEKSGFYKYFKNVIDYLLSHSNVIIHYVTNDPNDAIFKLAEKQPRIKPYYIGLKKTITLMMKMDADIVVMTTPDIQNYYIKRSYVRKDIEYIYVFHGLGSTNMVVRKGAYDHFDTILCVGQHQIDEIRETEEMYGLPKKNLVPCGYGLLDNLIASYKKAEKSNSATPIILIAPSWQPDNILDSCLEKMLDSLRLSDYCIVVRPHPEYIKRFPAKMERLLTVYADKLGPNFYFETDFSSNSSIFMADMLITDWSGVAFEYSFTTERPSLFIDTTMKVLNPDYTKYKNPPLDISLRNQVGKSIKPEEVGNIIEVVNSMFDEKDIYVERIKEVRSKYIFNLGESGRVGGEYILHKLIKKK